MSTRCPLVSIGVPVYNGERYLEQSLESLLAQTYENLKIILLDNASTDRTGEICRRYAESDSRIRYPRNEKNLGHTVNTNQIVPMARGTYYRQHHDDDLMMPRCTEACVQALESDTKAVLAHTDTKTNDGSGKIIYEGDPVDYRLAHYRTV